MVGLGWIGLLVVFTVFGTVERIIALLIAAGIVVIIVTGAIGYSVAYYRRFEYDLTADTFNVNYGVFSRRDREIPYYRIQNVSISKNIVHRLVGIAEVRVETAGGQSSEVHLRFVSDRESRRLQEEITERKREASADDEADEPLPGAIPTPREAGTPLFEISSKELALLGVVSFDLRLAFVLIATASFFGPEVVAELFNFIPALVFAPVAIIAVYLAGAVVSGIVAVTNYWDFRLFELPDELRYDRGLLRQFSGSIPFEKIQTIIVSENVLARQVGYGKLLIETAGYSPGETSGSQTAVPLATQDRVFDLATSIEPFGRPTFIRPPKRTRQRYLHRYVYVVAVITAIGYAINWTEWYTFEWYLLPALALLAPVAAHLKWSHIGFTVQDDYVITRSGFWNRRAHVVPYHRIQTVFERQTVFQRRWDLASVRIDTAGTRSLGGQDATAVDIDAEVATQLREYVHDNLQREVSIRHAPFQWVGSTSSSPT